MKLTHLAIAGALTTLLAASSCEQAAEELTTNQNTDG